MYKIVSDGDTCKGKDGDVSAILIGWSRELPKAQIF